MTYGRNPALGMSDELRAEARGLPVYLDGRLIATATSLDDATLVQLCLNYIGLSADQIPSEVDRRLKELLA